MAGSRAWMSFPAAVFVAFALATGPVVAASGSDKVFTIANYPVEARAKDAVTAKDKAMTDGQHAAFRSLLKRIVPVTAYEQIKKLNNIKAGDLIDGVAVRSESNSSTEYIASLDFAFQPDGVRTILRREGVPFVDSQAGAVVLVPAVRDGATPVSGASAAWTSAWKGLDLAHTLTPVQIEALKPAIHADTLTMLAEGQSGADRILKSEYRAERVLVAIADLDPAARRLTVTLAGEDAVGPVAWTRSYRMAPGDHAYALELAAVVTLGVLEGRWKAVNSGGGHGLSGGAPVQLVVQFSSIGEWNDIRGQILDTDGVEDVRIDGVSARSADISLSYPGGAGMLVDAMAAKGLSLRNDDGIWVLRSRF